jgi:adenylate kinase
MVCVVLLGPPGSGKGTQGQLVAGRLSIPAISTGDIFRSHVAAGTPLGRSAQVFIDGGDLVPDSITCAMVGERLDQADTTGGFLLDGFPRTKAQAELLQGMLAERGHELTRVIELRVDEAELVDRLSARRVFVDGQSVQRNDDAPETIRHRLEVYRQQTAPLSDWYEAAGLLSRIDASGDVDEITGRLLDSLGQDGATSTGSPPMPIGQPEDIAHTASFLCSEDAGFVSGQVIYVAGGPRD